MYFLIKLGRHVNYREMMDTIDFEGQRSRSKWTYIEIGVLDMLAMVREWTLLILEVKGQGHGHSGHMWK